MRYVPRRFARRTSPDHAGGTTSAPLATLARDHRCVRAAPNAKPPTGEEQIPATVKGWNGKKAVVTGFMIPVKMEKGLVTEFLLMRNTMACCYGAVPNMNEWVIVKMKKGVAPLMDVPVAFYGELKVGAMFENGYMTGLYELDGERMGEVQG